MKITVADALAKVGQLELWAETYRLAAQEAQKNGQTEFELTDAMASLADEDRAQFQALIDKAP